MINDYTLIRHHCWPSARVVHVVPDCYHREHQVVVRRGFLLPENMTGKLCLLEASM